MIKQVTNEKDKKINNVNMPSLTRTINKIKTLLLLVIS